MRFLIVDDSKAMQTIVRKTLVSAGYADHEFKFAFNGNEALSIIREWRPDIVLSDWHMPEMSGLELLQQVKTEGLKVKVGLVTTERSKQNMEEAKEAGALFVVSKPFNAETLHEAVEDALTDTGEQPEKDVQYDLVLPSANNIARAINSFCRHKVTITRCSKATFDYSVTPFMTGIYEDSSSGRAGIVVIIDASAACYVGAAMQDTDVKEATVSIENHLIPKAMFDICKSLMNLISTLIYDRKEEVELNVKAVHLINDPEGKLKTLIEKKKDQAQCLQINIESYGNGKMHILKL